MPEKIFSDCCDLCEFVDDNGREIEVCVEMTQRCKGDTCSSCQPCKRFSRRIAFVSADKLPEIRKRGKTPRKAGKLRQGAVQ